MAIQLIVASPEPRFRDFAREQVAHISTVELVAEYEDAGGNLHVRILHDRELYPHAAVLLDISSDPEQGLSTLERLIEAAPGMYVILSDHQMSGDFLLRAMRMGSSDFLQLPLKLADFHEAMARLEQHMARLHSQERQIGKIYSFASVKGGIGATTAAINFAAICARQGKSTVLLDLDLDSGDAAAYLGLRHQYSIADAVENLDRLDQSMLEGILARDALGFSVLCAPEEIEKSRLIGEQQVRDIASILVERFDVVVVDGSRGLDGLLLSCLELSNSIFLMLTQEFPALRNAQHYLNALVRAGFGHEAVKIVVNRHAKRGALYATLEQVQQTLGMKPFWVLPNQYEEAMNAVHEARPIVMRAKSELGQSYRGFGKKLGFDGQPASAAATAGRGK
ncbi:MAG: AAA family ATPase [Acidobacteria bacterium]|nr:AAA family ATPase [Acidobacteriota bacterium]